MCFFFFFQAEDGIRDVAVTGVQTCALPISVRGDPVHVHAALVCDTAVHQRLMDALVAVGELGVLPHYRDLRLLPRIEDRSEERRVGKECRSRWSPYH